MGDNFAWRPRPAILCSMAPVSPQCPSVWFPPPLCWPLLPARRHRPRTRAARSRATRPPPLPPRRRSERAGGWAMVSGRLVPGPHACSKCGPTVGRLRIFAFFGVHSSALDVEAEKHQLLIVDANWTVHKPSHFYGIRVSRFLPCLGPSRCFLVHHLLSHCHSRFSLFGRIKSGAPLRRLLSTSMFSRKPTRSVGAR